MGRKQLRMLKMCMLFILLLFIMNVHSSFISDFLGATPEDQSSMIMNFTNITDWSGNVGCDPPGIGPGEQPGIGSRWFLPIAVAAVLSVVIGVLFYFGRMFFNDPSVSAWMKKELYQIIANIFLILFIVFLLGLINPQIAKVIQSVHGLDSPCTLQQAACYYTLSVRNSMLVDTVSLAIMQSVVHLASTLELPAIPFGFVQFDLNMNEFYMVLEGYFGKLIEAYALGMAEWVVKASLIQFISTLLIELLLPFGLIMRNFSVTRKAGGAIIALSLSLYFIYPATSFVGTGEPPESILCATELAKLTPTIAIISRANDATRLSRNTEEYGGRILSAILFFVKNCERIFNILNPDALIVALP